MASPSTVLPGLTLTLRLHELAAKSVADHVPDRPPLTWEEFTSPARWALIPDETTGRAYKAEHTLRDHPDGTLLRLTLWFAADLRRDGRPYPHSHPWPFTSKILAGGYRESLWTCTDGAVEQTAVSVLHAQGGTNVMPREHFHEVHTIEDPGATLTLMIGSGPGVRGGWGHLDPDTATYTPAPRASDRWRAMYRHLNPHLR